MNIGLCLAGGGAKGSYQAGVIKALFEKGLKITSLSGTSIGAVNGYYIFTGNVDKLEKVWTNIQKTANNNVKIVDKVVDNSPIIDELKALNDELNSKFDFFVNYVEIKNKNVEERVVNLINLNKSDSINYVKYSSLLPFDPNSKLEFKEQFLQNVVDGVYDNKNLDGGLVRNTLIEPLIEDNVDKIIIISTRYDYNISDDIKKLYDEKNIIVVRPKTEFGPNDTLRFENEFCTKMFNEGYEIGKNLYI